MTMGSRSVAGGLVSLALTFAPLVIEQAHAYTQKSLRNANNYQEQQDPQVRVDIIFVLPGALALKPKIHRC